MRYKSTVKPATDLSEKLDEAPAPAEPGYAAWKRAKIERGLEQAKDREAMIPVEQLWRDLTLEG